MSPVRLYLFASVIYLFAVAQQPSGGSDGTAEADQPAAASEETAATEGSSGSGVPTQAEIDALKAWLPPETGARIDDLMNRPGGPESVGMLLQLPGDLIERIPQEASDLERAWFSVSITFLHDPGFFQDQIAGNLSIGAIFFVPVAALLLALIYRRKKRYYAEHMVFQFHVQTFSFLMTSVVVLLPAGIIGSLGRTALGLWALCYAVAALKHFYGDGWMRTVFKVFLLIILNAVVVTPILFATVAMRLM